MKPHSSAVGSMIARTPLLETKLYIPKRRAGLVSRPRLIERMQCASERKLTLISAPAGFGKTTLLAEWLASNSASERVTAWVSLDRSDNDPTLFWAYFIAALQKVRSEVGANALSMLHALPPPPLEAMVTALLNDLTASANDFVLILDDYHVIEAPPIHNTLAFLLDHLPRQMHLIVAGRSDPPLPLARLRVRGESAELRAVDLRFTSEEATAFLNERMKLNLSAAEMTALESRTEGWIAGLQLAALSLQARNDVAGFITAFTGNDRYIVDYLVEEVLQRQPERVRSFLLQTSILDRLSGPLCDAVTEREDGRRMLEALDRGNLFIVPLDDRREWYRYHHLFADVLRAHAREEQTAQMPILHRRAAAWFEARGMAAEAIEQARAASDHETVARLLVANFEAFERIGRYASLARWFASLPEEMIRKRPRLALSHALVALASDNNNQAARRLASWVEDALNKIASGGGFDPSNDIGGTVVGLAGLEALKGEMLALKIFTSGRKLPPEEVVALAEQARDLLPPTRQRMRGMLHMVHAGLQIWRSDLKSALPSLERSVEEARRTQSPSLLVDMLTHRGEVYVLMGRLEDGRRSFEEALLLGQTLSAEGNWGLCSPHTALAEVLLERADLAGAIEHVARALEFAGKSPMRSPVLYARTTAAHVFLTTGDIKAALEQLEQAHAFVRGSSDSRYVSFLSSVQLKFYCQAGDLEAAAYVVRERNLSPDAAVDRNNEEEMTAFARYLLSRGAYLDAAQVLTSVLPLVRNIGRVQHEIHALVLQAMTHEFLEPRALALEALGRATFLGEPSRFNRTFTRAGARMIELLEALADAVQSRRGGSPIEAGSLSYLAYLLREMRSKPVTASALVEPLTAREIEILRLIATGLRNHEIAERLFISLHTVKRHVANAYAKLDVTHRTEAVARANELKLL